MITLDEEQHFWESGVFNTQTPEGLLNAVFYYNGVNFVLRGGEEHRSLKLSQFVLVAHQIPKCLEKCWITSIILNMDQKIGQEEVNN